MLRWLLEGLIGDIKGALIYGVLFVVIWFYVKILRSNIPNQIGWVGRGILYVVGAFIGGHVLGCFDVLPYGWLGTVLAWGINVAAFILCGPWIYGEKKWYEEFLGIKMPEKKGEQNAVRDVPYVPVPPGSGGDSGVADMATSGSPPQGQSGGSGGVNGAFVRATAGKET